jgi:hypothetical protein
MNTSERNTIIASIDSRAPHREFSKILREDDECLEGVAMYEKKESYNLPTHVVCSGSPRSPPKESGLMRSGINWR